MRALNLLRHDLAYRRESFDTGLKAAGFKVAGDIDRPRRGDVLVIWNRYGGMAETADRFEAVGARVIVVENGYLGKAWRPGVWLALSLGHHAGAGHWPDLGSERWDSWAVDFAPWRRGEETIIFAQRSIGERDVRSPHDWAESALRRFGGRIRAHPGVDRPARTLEEDLQDARCAITWNSGAALRALLLGVPVFYEFDRWIGAAAAKPVKRWGEPLCDDAARLAMFRRLAWAMCTVDEIRSGEAIDRLLG